MSTSWLIAKYISDMRRREPRNIGVILFHEGDAYLRFIGERESGAIDGRRTKWAGDGNIYRAWVDYWRRIARTGDVQTLVNRLPDSAYFVEAGGERIVGLINDPDVFLDDLYTLLVEAAPDPETLSVAERAESVLSAAGIRDRVQRGYRFAMNDSPDQAYFDYRFDNGAVNLMRRVQLSFSDERSWDYAHSAAWAFQLLENRQVENRPTQRISLVRLRSHDPQLSRQVELLERFGPVIDVGQEDAAVGALRHALHI